MFLVPRITQQVLLLMEERMFAGQSRLHTGPSVVMLAVPPSVGGCSGREKAAFTASVDPEESHCSVSICRQTGSPWRRDQGSFCSSRSSSGSQHKVGQGAQQVFRLG